MPQTIPDCSGEDSTFDRQIAYGILRVALGVNLVVHGLVRLPHLKAFAAELAGQFANTPLPQFSVRTFALTLPFAETAVGVLLTLGLWTRCALIIGGLLMIALVFVAQPCAATEKRSVYR